MMEKEIHTKATMALPTAGSTKPISPEDEIIEEILRAAGLEALD